MTAQQAKKLKPGDKVRMKKYKNFKVEDLTVEYVSFNPTCCQYFIATTDGWGGYHKRMEKIE